MNITYEAKDLNDIADMFDKMADEFYQKRQDISSYNILKNNNNYNFYLGQQLAFGKMAEILRITKIVNNEKENL